MTELSWLADGQAPWLRRFHEDPDRALSDLLTGRAYLGRLNAADPDQLLLDWGQLYGAEFVSALDAGLDAFLAAHWLTDGDSGSPEVAFHRFFRTVALLEPAPERTLSSIWGLRSQAVPVLSPLVTSAARDALGWYWAALSRHQLDDSMTPLWFDLCRLPPGTPTFHGRYGLLGLRRVPGEDLGRFRLSVAEGLQQYIAAVERRVTTGAISQGQGERLVKAELELARRAYPFQSRWSDFWAGGIDGGQLAGKWVASVFGPSRPRPASKPSGSRRADRLRPDPSWTERSRSISSRLSREGSRALSVAELLLNEQRAYYRATGQTYNLVRSLCNFSSSFVLSEPMTAVRWAREAWEIAPENPYTWTTLFRSLLALGEAGSAITIGFTALDRFPYDRVVANGLADVLERSGQFEEAEALYRQTLARHPDDTVTANGLAGVLKTVGRLDDAEVLYRQTLARHPDDTVTANGLAGVLKTAGRLDDAEVLYRQTLARHPDDSYAANGLAGVLKTAGRLDEVQAPRRESDARCAADTPSTGASTVNDQEVFNTAGAAPDSRHPHSEPDAPAGSSAGVDVRAFNDRRDEGSAPSGRGEYQAEVERSGFASQNVATVDLPAHLTSEMRLRAGAVRLRLVAGRNRSMIGDALLADTESHLERNPRDIGAAFTRGETFLRLGRLAEATETLDRLPNYIGHRPEFLALRGSVELAKIHAEDEPAYDVERLECVRKPWREAATQFQPLRAASLVAGFRAVSIMVDGAAVESARSQSAAELSKLIARQSELEDASVADSAVALDGWFVSCVAEVLHALGNGSSETGRTEAVHHVHAESVALDSLQASFLSAARYEYAPAA